MIHLAGVMPNRSGHDERFLGRVFGQKKIVVGEEVVSDQPNAGNSRFSFGTD
jgi:hypothetical protein